MVRWKCIPGYNKEGRRGRKVGYWFKIGYELWVMIEWYRAKSQCVFNFLFSIVPFEICLLLAVTCHSGLALQSEAKVWLGELGTGKCSRVRHFSQIYFTIRLPEGCGLCKKEFGFAGVFFFFFLRCACRGFAFCVLRVPYPRYAYTE